jgi:predicted phosphodiesterase
VHIAVIADTHNRLPESVREALRGADEIWHLGDICRPELLAEIRSFGPPVHAVRGNCDPHGLAPASLLLERGGNFFYLLHEPPGAIPAAARFALHGHTHRPRDETANGVRFLNPGSVGKPNHGAPASFAWLDLAPDGRVDWRIEPVG